ncbi:MAG: chorismate synthase, partial [Bacilli bacterium]|nr:chorismate synthase [Bacilli bacterium]
ASDYKDLENVFRPSHADYVSYIKYGRKSNGGGQFSGRMTAALVAINAILLDALKEKGIAIGSYVKQVGNIIDETEIGDINGTINRLNSDFFPTLDGQIKNKMISLIDEARNNGDSIGGKITTIVYNLIPGVGEPFFDSLESTISHAMFSIPAVKGITFGLGQSFAESYGSKVNDEFILKDCLIKTKTNFNGGINGGISNGMPIIFECIVKPTPSISLKQKTLTTKCEEVEIAINGRHDACLVRRIIPVINGLTAFVIFDNLLSVLGAKFFE